MSEHAFQRCIHPDCAATYGVDEVHVSCPKCGSLLDVVYDWERLAKPKWRHFEYRWMTKGDGDEGHLDFSGVWLVTRESTNSWSWSSDFAFLPVATNIITLLP